VLGWACSPPKGMKIFRFSNRSPRTHHSFLFVIPSVPGFPTSPPFTVTTYVVLPQENHMQLTEAATVDRKSGEASGSAVRPSQSRKPRVYPLPLLLLPHLVTTPPFVILIFERAMAVPLW
jgi:hypothetical protein